VSAVLNTLPSLGSSVLEMVNSMSEILPDFDREMGE
jgi:hypothetical protein